MSAILAGKKIAELKSLSSEPAVAYHKVYFASEIEDNFSLKDKNVSGATFTGLSLKNARFNDINFSHCIFINCYLRGTKFYNCNFTGSKFYECNLRGAEMANCDLSYSQWKETNISKNIILANLPAHENVAQELLINLRLNANSIGEYDDARTYVYESEDKSRRYNLSKVRGSADYYKNKYSLDQRVAALLRYLKSHAERLIWGYGEKVFNLSLTAAILVVLFGFGYFISEQQLFMDSANNGVIGGYISALKVSLSVFTGFNLTAVDATVKEHLYNWFLIEALTGLIFIGFLAASLHRRISMRRD